MAIQPPSPRPPSTASTALITAIGGVVLLAVLAMLAALAWYERSEAFERVEERNALLARVFADQAARNVETASLAAASAAEALQRGAAPGSPEVLAGLQQTLTNLPFLRGIAVVAADGRVLASASAGEAGLSIGLAALGALPEPGTERLGPFVPVRGLRDLAHATGSAPAGVGVLPLLRGTTLGGRQRAWVLVLLNPTAFANFQQTTLADQGAAAALLGYDGQLLAATESVERLPGSSLATLAPFLQFLPKHEHGAWTGDGLRPGAQLASFRVAISRPLVVVVEQARADAVADWLRRCRGLAGAALAATLLVVGMTRLAVRSLRAREAAHTERDQAQAAATQRVQAQLAFTRQLLEASPLPVSVTDARLRYVTVNQAWEAFHGRAREQAIGQAVGTHLPAAEQRVHEAYNRLLLKQREPLRYESTVTAGDGTARDVVVNKMLVPGEDGRAEGILTVMVDVTEFRNAERATREARDAAEEASRAKSEFIANISHELRTPLQAIIGFSELGAHRGREHTRLAAMFADIHGAGQRMLALVNDLLDVAKIESTVGTIHLERIDLRGVLRDVLRELQPLLERRQLHVNLQLPQAPMRGKMDPLRIQQVLRNVLANAIKFSPAGSAIDIHGEHTVADELHVAIADRGPGIPPGEIEKIFEAFVQSTQTKDGSGGTGLGLAICRKIALAHGGHITAENREGGGSVFRLVLPARSANETMPLPL